MLQEKKLTTTFLSIVVTILCLLCATILLISCNDDILNTPATVEDPNDLQPLTEEGAELAFQLFTVTPVTDAQAYKLEIASDILFTDILFSRIDYPGPELAGAADLEIGTTYYWRGAARKNWVWGYPTEGRSFRLSTLTGQLPAPEGSTTDTRPTLSWDEAEDAVSYQLRIDSTEAALAALAEGDYIEIEDPTYQLAETLHLGDQRWWSVRAVNEDGLPGAWTEPRSFTVVFMLLQAVQGGSSSDIPGGTANGTWSVSDFHIGRYPVTQSQYEAVMGHNPSDSSRGIGPDNPVNRVSWYDTLVFCNTLSLSEGLYPVYSINGSTDPDDWGAVPTSSNSTWNAVVMNIYSNGYRLPTEAEWEWAARGGVHSNGYTYAGSNSPEEVGWYSGNSGGSTHPVGEKLPNELGLYDLSGNVWEWAWDRYSSSALSGSDPTGPASGSYRRLRGGSWNNSAPFATVSHRNYGILSPYGRSYYYGFRVVCRP